jgi:hypothetical protein
MDRTSGRFDSHESEALGSKLPALFRPPRPPAIVPRKRLLLPHWRVIVVAVLASGAGVAAAVVWPLFPNRTGAVVQAGAVAQQGREAASRAAESAPPPMAKMTTAAAPSTAGFNTAEPAQVVTAEPAQAVVRPEHAAERSQDTVRPERATSVMRSDRQALVLKLGSSLLKDGNVAAARLMLQSAADAGNAQAAMLLGATYDPLILADLGVRGLRPDREAARTWYRRAQEYGSSEASGRIERLARMDN